MKSVQVVKRTYRKGTTHLINVKQIDGTHRQVRVPDAGPLITRKLDPTPPMGPTFTEFKCPRPGCDGVYTSPVELEDGSVYCNRCVKNTRKEGRIQTAMRGVADPAEAE